MKIKTNKLFIGRILHFAVDKGGGKKDIAPAFLGPLAHSSFLSFPKGSLAFEETFPALWISSLDQDFARNMQSHTIPH